MTVIQCPAEYLQRLEDHGSVWLAHSVPDVPFVLREVTGRMDWRGNPITGRAHVVRQIREDEAGHIAAPFLVELASEDCTACPHPLANHDPVAHVCFACSGDRERYWHEFAVAA